MNRQIAVAGHLKEEALWFSVDPDLLMLRAQQLYGEGDLGDPICQEGLIHLAASLEKSASLTPLGRVLTYFDLLRLLGNALGVQRALREHPASVHEIIRAPVVITGLPRSGTTFLHRLLAQHPAHRVLRHWEAMRPAHSPWTAR